MDLDHSISDIAGLSPLPDGGLVISDSNNKCIKRLDKQFSVMDKLDLDDIPASVSVNGTEAAVNLRWGQTVLIVSLVGSMRVVRKIDTGYANTELACHKDKFFCAGQTKLGLLELGRFDWFSGEKEKHMALQYEGQLIKAYARQESVSDDGGIVYIATGGDGVVLVDRNWQVLKKLNDYWVTLGVCAGMADCCYISGYDLSSNNDSLNKHAVKQYNSDGDFIGTIINDDQLLGKGVGRLCYIRDRGILVVACCNKSDILQHYNDIGIFYLTTSKHH